MKCAQHRVMCESKGCDGRWMPVKEKRRNPIVMSTFTHGVIITLLALTPAVLLAGELKPPDLGAAVWIDQSGKGDRGVAYRLAIWHSLTDRSRWVEALAIVGNRGAGAVVAREVYASELEGQRYSLSLGLGGVVPYDVGSSGDVQVVLVGVARLKRRDAE